ncbi:hypothetical protein RvY_01143 [Ramazzottius varieornatus]|uniref:RGS domain-containing protein n=1 Tax=Ramazzottius varieornatus TaxID=947166 RepID=A0A1D1UFN0_RAMVA|nr:hypothetical protein RvY_01143 [Ramazzottius varieornatus]
MNCFSPPKTEVSIHSPKSRRKMIPPPVQVQSIPTILETQDVADYLKTCEVSSSSFSTDTPSTATTNSSASHSDLLDRRRLSFRPESDTEESNYNSSSPRTTPSFTAGNFVFDFDNIELSRSSSGYSTPSPKVFPAEESKGGAVVSGAMFLDIPREAYLAPFGPITNSHSSDKLVSNVRAATRNRPSVSLGVSSTIHLSRSCSMLTKGIFGGKSGDRPREGSRRSPDRLSRCSFQVEWDESSSKTPDTSRKSSDSDTDHSIFTRLIHRWYDPQNVERTERNRTVPAHALFLRYKHQKKDKKASRSHSETEVVEKTVKQRFRLIMRRNTESVCAVSKQPKSPRPSAEKKSGSSKSSVSHRPTPEEARSWQESLSTLLANPYGTALFRAFLKLEYNEENLAFFLACEKFKRLSDSAGNKKIAAKAQKIYDEFVKVEAPREVNLDSLTRQIIITNLSNPNRYAFENAQRKVYNVLEKDCYPRFLKFHLYTQLLQGED